MLTSPLAWKKMPKQVPIQYMFLIEILFTTCITLFKQNRTKRPELDNTNYFCAKIPSCIYILRDNIQNMVKFGGSIDNYLIN